MGDNGIAPSMTAAELRAGWTPRRVGRRIVTLGETPSTNTLALAAASEPDADGLAILADLQTAGRGRLGASWLSPRGASVLCSVVLLERQHPPRRREDDDQASLEYTSEMSYSRVPPEGEKAECPLFEARTSAWLTQASAVAACDAVRQATAVTPAIRWPNDLRVAGRKVGGILIETRVVEAGTRAWVVGIGINCLQHAGHFPPELRATATSLEQVTRHPVDRGAVARELLKALDRRLSRSQWGRTERVHADWLAYAEPIGQKVRLRRDGRECTGWLVEVDPAGGLIVRLETGQQEWFDPMRTKLL